jgi:formylmethanofuran dehydrogenase subunit E
MKKLLIRLIFVSGFLGLSAAGCSPYELNDPTCAKVTIIEEKTSPEKKPVVQEKAEKPAVVASSQVTSGSADVLKCGNCGHEIGKQEKAFVHKGQIMCSGCYEKLKNQQ